MYTCGKQISLALREPLFLLGISIVTFGIVAFGPTTPVVQTRPVPQGFSVERILAEAYHAGAETFGRGDRWPGRPRSLL